MKFLIFFVSLIIVGITILFFFQSKLLFFPAYLEKDYAFKFSVPFEEKFISYSDEKMIHGLLFKPPEAKARILYFHGNGGALDSWGFAGSDLAQKLNCEVLMLDYPGYGKSSSGLAPSEKILLESAEEAYKVFEAENSKKLPLILYGRSLGTGVASYLATKHSVKALILETPYTSIKAMASALFPIIPSFFIRYDLNNQKNIQKATLPILIIHGAADSVIPYTHSQILVKENPRAKLITIEGGDHNNLSDFPEYWKSVKNFLN